ncbi:uncharacterized protein LOC103891653 [Pongo abelii]|uniref:uncharacterized protein LOC103891653 n=1 Tax=Pongo abelii TaxID=9601 RepID=UPI0023E7D627|nr:uncharacterized protein LOC103891653 [Pongo abelii]
MREETSQAHSCPLPDLLPPAVIPAGWGATVTRGCSLKFIGTPSRNDLRWESRGKEREREGAAACGNAGSSREAERDCRVPLDLHRHSGCLGRKGEALCVPPGTWTWVPSVYACLWRCVSYRGSDSVRSGFEGLLQKLAEIRGGGWGGGHTPFLGTTWKTLNLPSSAFPPRLFFCCQVFLINGGAGSSGSREPVCARVGGGGRAWRPGFDRHAPGAEPGARGGRVWNLPSECSPSPLGPSHSPPPPHSPPQLLSLSPTPHGYRELSGNRRDFSGCRLRCIYPNKSSSQASCKKRLPARVYTDTSAQRRTRGGF